MLHHIKAFAIIALAASGFAASLHAQTALNVYGPGGPGPAMQEAARTFGATNKVTVNVAAGFIKGNMPSGITHVNAVLTDEQAFDVAAYVNSQPRPIKGNLQADFPARKNKPVDAAFPPYTPGFSAEQHKYGPWQPIQAAREKGVVPLK